MKNKSTFLLFIPIIGFFYIGKYVETHTLSEILNMAVIHTVYQTIIIFSAMLLLCLI